MFGKISKGVIGILLIPVAIGVSEAFFESLTGMGGARGTGSRIFLLGALSYVIMHLFILKPNYIYTLGHELMHAIATFLCGGRVKSFRASKDGGAVETTKTNVFITLSPYFVPTYTLLFSFLYIVIPLFFKIPKLGSIYFFLAGFTLMLHLVFTADVLKKEQPDIINTGYIFSMVIIYIANILLIGLVLSFLFKGVSGDTFLHKTFLNSKDIYVKIFRQLFIN